MGLSHISASNKHKFGNSLVIDVNIEIYVPCDLPSCFHEIFPNSAPAFPQPAGLCVLGSEVSDTVNMQKPPYKTPGQTGVRS